MPLTIAGRVLRCVNFLLSKFQVPFLQSLSRLKLKDTISLKRPRKSPALRGSDRLNAPTPIYCHYIGQLRVFKHKVCQSRKGHVEFGYACTSLTPGLVSL
jgi:hypothetical protein